MTDEQSMVERVARALCVHAGSNPDSTKGGWLDDNHSSPERSPSWKMFVDDARVALDAIHVQRLVKGLTGIALFPITDPKNMDAVNMQKMAMEALNWHDDAALAEPQS